MKTIYGMALLVMVYTAGAQTQAEIDSKVEKFLKDHKNERHDLNVPFVDGQTLHDIIVKKGYQSALEIGTSTGHSTIWIAWAMSKTGGKVTTLEISEKRQKEAIRNLTEAGLIKFVDLRLGDGHELVKAVAGPFDFVFSDADKDWYKQYFLDVTPKLKTGGCFTTHNVIDGNSPPDYIDFVQKNTSFETTIDRKSRAGIMISYKK